MARRDTPVSASRINRLTGFPTVAVFVGGSSAGGASAAIADTCSTQSARTRQHSNFMIEAMAVEIRRRDGTVFRILPLRKSKASPLDVRGVRLKASAADLVAIVREDRERG